MIMAGERLQNGSPDVLTARFRNKIQLLDHNNGRTQLAGKAVSQQQIAQNMTVFHDHAAVNMLVAGKTGTAETGNSNPNAWFIGFAPYENPVAAIAIVIENDAEHTATALAGDVLQVAVETLGGN